VTFRLRDDPLAGCSFFGGDDFVEIVNSIASNRNSFIKSTVSSGWLANGGEKFRLFSGSVSFEAAKMNTNFFFSSVPTKNSRTA
jgi:hypothetical protein